jgi:hypothetical protein
MFRTESSGPVHGGRGVAVGDERESGDAGGGRFSREWDSGAAGWRWRLRGAVRGGVWGGCAAVAGNGEHETEGKRPATTAWESSRDWRRAGSWPPAGSGAIAARVTLERGRMKKIAAPRTRRRGAANLFVVLRGATEAAASLQPQVSPSVEATPESAIAVVIPADLRDVAQQSKADYYRLLVHRTSFVGNQLEAGTTNRRLFCARVK